MATKKGLLERLNQGIVIGDGGYVVALEKRGYVTAGPWTPEAVIENPEAVKQLHREFIRSGSDVIQAFTFFSSEDKLEFGGNTRQKEVSCKEICKRGCAIAKEVAAEGDVLVAGSISRNVAFELGKGKKFVQAEVEKQNKIFIENQIDFLICEYFNNIVEMEWTIEASKKSGLPVVASMCIGVLGDENDISIEECGIRMVEAGADVVGVNCLYDPAMTIEAIRKMNAAFKTKGLSPHLITQPNGFFTTGTGKDGYLECPEFPFAMEARVVTRFDCHKYARDAYEEGVRFIGGCCGFEAYHIRAIAEELTKERNNYLPPASAKHEPWGGKLKYSISKQLNRRATKSHWENLVPNSGRPRMPTYELPSFTNGYHL